MARLSFSYVMPGLFFLRPHMLATASDWTNLKTPDSLSSHLRRDGFKLGSFNKSLINSHKWLPFDATKENKLNENSILFMTVRQLDSQLHVWNNQFEYLNYYCHDLYRLFNCSLINHICFKYFILTWSYSLPRWDHLLLNVFVWWDTGRHPSPRCLGEMTARLHFFFIGDAEWIVRLATCGTASSHIAFHVGA